MAQAMFSLRVTLMEMYECGDLVDLPSAAIITAVSRIAQVPFIRIHEVHASSGVYVSGFGAKNIGMANTQREAC